MVASATCPRCGHLNELMACSNCGGTEFRRGGLSDGTEGMICKSCNIGFSHFLCQGGCGTMLPATALGTTTSRIAERVSHNLRAADGGPCFIASELYGPGSAEVAALRSFRDRRLLGSRAGRALVRAYYRVSPRLIPLLRRSKALRRVVGRAVALAVRLVERR
jgi:hypothetical protein